MSELYDALPSQSNFDKSKYRLGKLCKREHDWMGTGQGLRRISDGRCLECKKQRNASPEESAYKQKWYEQNIGEQRRKARERMAKLRQDPEHAKILRERSRKNNAKMRALNGRISRTGLLVPPHLLGHGIQSADLHPFIAAGWVLNQLDPATVTESCELWRYLKAFHPSQTVADLVQVEEKTAWSTEKIEFMQKDKTEEEWKKEIKRLRHHVRMTTDPEYVLYHRQKSKRRKAQMRESVAIQITGKQIRERFAEFNHHCGYCGAAGDLHIEHVVPISKGGPHAIGNIIPACKSCNFSKRDHEVESWYRTQPFFTTTRWRKICRVLGWNRSSVGQLALL